MRAHAPYKSSAASTANGKRITIARYRKVGSRLHSATKAAMPVRSSPFSITCARASASSGVTPKARPRAPAAPPSSPSPSALMSTNRSGEPGGARRR